MDLQKDIKKLVTYGLDKKLIMPEDEIYTINQYLEVFRLDEYEDPDIEGEEIILPEILDRLTDTAYDRYIIKSDDIVTRDLFDTKLMGILTPKPSQPTNPSNPSNPTKPSDPSKPTNPSNPTKPTNNKKKPAAKGTTLKDSKGATYKVTGAKVKNPTVTYVKPKKNVKKVSIPATITVKGVKYQVTAVSKDAFKNNKKVTQVTIDKNVNNIGKNAFYGCKNLKKVIIKTTKLTKKTVGKNAFKGIHKKATIKVPKKKLDAYKKILKNAGISKSVKVVKM